MNNDLKRVGLVFDSQGNVDFVKSLKEVNSVLKESYNQFKINQSQWTNSTTTTEKLIQQQEYLKQKYEAQASKVEILRRQLEELNSAEDKNEKAIAKKEKELNQAQIQLNKYGVQLDEVKSKLSSSVAKHEEFVKSLQNAGDSIEKVGKKVSVLSGITAGAMTASVKSAIDFESAFTGVEKTVNGTTEELEELKKGIRKLATEIPSTTTEISAVAEAAGQLGIQTDNILEFTKTMINMGNATNLSANDAATTLARFANITKMSQTDFDRLASTIVELGNNFATTESEIAQMGMNLASAGSQIGMTQAEIMALATALSSVGLEAQAGGTAFSKLMIKMQLAVETGSEELTEFANVAGMSAKDFADAFKKDATKALLSFIKGLSKSGEQGQSAIKILNDMGITETRLRDSILRSTNAADLFSNAIKLGSNAWKDNTALTNEANKRYDTLKSKLEIVKNKLLDKAVTLGNKLMPVLEKMLDGIGKWIDKLGNLNDHQIETILKIGAMVVAIGPVITILGKLTSGVGSTIKGFSTFCDALKVAHGTMTSTSTAVNNLSKVFSALTSPVGLAVTAIGAIAGGLAIYNATTENSSKVTKKFIEEIDKNVEAYEELKKAQDEEASNNMLYMKNTENLYNELQKITDENGHIQEGYEARAKFIVNELSNSLGIEISMTDGIINNYKDLQDEINKTISLKKANIILDLYEERYKNAIENEAKAYADYIAISEKVIETKNLLKEAEQEVVNSMESGNEQRQKNAIIRANMIHDELESLEAEEVRTKKVYDEMLSNITAYEEGSSIILSENIDDINDWMVNSQLSLSKNSENQDSILTDSLKKFQYNVDYYKKLSDEDVANKNEAGRQANENQIRNNQQMLQTTIDSLLQQTSAINENSPDVINAWRYLAQNNKDTFNNTISSLPDDLKNTILKMAGIKNNNSLFDAARNLANTFKSPFKNLTNETGPLMKNAMDPMYDEMNKSSTSLFSKATNIANGILERMRKGFDIHSPSRETRKIFKNVMRGAEIGIEDEESNLYNQANDVTNNVLDELNNATNQSSTNNYSNYNSSNANFIIDYNQMYLSFLKALNNCKMMLDDDGFIRIVDDRIREVI